MKKYFLMIPAVLAIAAGRVLAADQPLALPGTGAPDLFEAGVKMVGGLAVLIALLLLAMQAVKRLGAGRAGLMGNRDMIKVIATKALAPKKYITLVEIGDAVLTLGVTDDRITRLDKVSSEDFRAQQPEVPETGGSPFARRLRALTGAGAPKAGDEE